MLDEYIENLRETIVSETCNIINIPSVSEETQNPEMLFGEGCKKALDYVLDLGAKLGFRTKNIDNYCGYIEFGEGEKMIGIIGHLDVVPSGDGWNTPPFEAAIASDRIYGRGAIDDKGPVISSLYAMKAIKDNLKINSRVRLILGVNEEKDWKCIKHYKETEESPTVGFSPDANFPCIYAEKGILTMHIQEDFSKYADLPIQITSIDCKNNAINVVPKFCEVNLKVDCKRLDFTECIDFINETIRELGFDISISTSADSSDNNNNNNINIISRGVQAHSAHPELGVNAISQALVLLNRIYKHYEISVNVLDFFEKCIGMEHNGKSMGIDLADESGSLTLNVGQFKFVEDDSNNKDNDNGRDRENGNNNDDDNDGEKGKDSLQVSLNLRIPVNTSIDSIVEKIQSVCAEYGLDAIAGGRQEPLYVPKDHYLVKTLTSIFNKATNSNLEPIPIGGGTYARAFDNCVSFGANFPGDTDMCHQANEFVDIDKLILSCKIYAEAIYELDKMIS